MFVKENCLEAKKIKKKKEKRKKKKIHFFSNDRLREEMYFFRVKIYKKKQL